MDWKRLERAAAMAMAAAVLLSCIQFFSGCRALRNDVVRLHVLANSDSPEDQRIKLAVRDALLDSGSALFGGVLTKENAEALLRKERKPLEETAKQVLRANGVSYSAALRLTNEYFTTRVYGEFTLPAGRYTAIKVVLGEGRGQNWWCVMYPPLCLPAAVQETGFTSSENAVLYADNSFEIRFKLVELIESWKERVRIYARTRKLQVES